MESIVRLKGEAGGSDEVTDSYKWVASPGVEVTFDYESEKKTPNNNNSKGLDFDHLSNTEGAAWWLGG